jgi:hypothetical protein
MEDNEPIEDAMIKDSRHVEREPEISKDKRTASDVESQSSEESEEEGEIGDSLITLRRSERGRPSSKDKREKETYKDKVQGSQPTLEFVLAKTPKLARNQGQGSKGGPTLIKINNESDLLELHRFGK